MESTELVAVERTRRRAAEQARRIRQFMQFAGVYLAIALFFLLINLFSDPGSLWFFWPILPFTVPLVILAWLAFALPRFDDQWVERRIERSLNRTVPEPQRSAPATEIDAIVDEASRLIDTMRRSARRIPKPAVRTQALEVCASADRVLSAISENPDEIVLARDFVGRYLAPASSIMDDYARLAHRNVASAQPTLKRVEDHDFPFLESKLNQVHDRLHRGSLIDLQIAREMLSFDVSDWKDDGSSIAMTPEHDAVPHRPATF